jgi:hypothetical protein
MSTTPQAQISTISTTTASALIPRGYSPPPSNPSNNPPFFNPKGFKFTCLERDSYANPSVIAISHILPNPHFEEDTRKHFTKKQRNRRLEILGRHQAELKTVYMTPLMVDRSRDYREMCEGDVREEVERWKFEDRKMEWRKREHERKVREIEELEREVGWGKKEEQAETKVEEEQVEEKPQGLFIEIEKMVREKMILGYIGLCAVCFLLALFPNLRTFLLKFLFR